MKKLYVVIPCYNEEEVLFETAKRLEIKMNNMMDEDLISKDSRVVLVNDGSKDKTWQMIEELHEKNPLFSGINLSRNRGHQNALLAGLMTVKDHCDVSISMDADLQDDINAMDEMMKKYLAGCDIVYGVRSARTTDTFFKRFTAEAFYRVMEKLGANRPGRRVVMSPMKCSSSQCVSSRASPSSGCAMCSAGGPLALAMPGCASALTTTVEVIRFLSSRLNC